MIIWFNQDIGMKIMEQTKDSTSNFEFSIIEPRNTEDLAKSLEILSSLEMLVKSGNTQYEALLNSQKINVSKYVDSIGKFNNSQLISNINFLLGKYGLRIGELEQIIGVSPGYISRTARENPSKKLSIDVVWKLAKLFDIPLEDMLDSEVSVPRDNTGMLSAFIKKLLFQTKTNKIQWDIYGGGMCKLNEKLCKLGLITFRNDSETYVYHPAHLNQEYTWIVTSDVVALKKFDSNCSLVIIPYAALKVDSKESAMYSADGYDFILISDDNKKLHWEKFFYTSEDAFGGLKELSSKLMGAIQDTWYEAQISSKTRDVIVKFLNS